MRHSVDLTLLDSVIARIKGFEGFFDEQIKAFDAAVTKMHGVWEGDAAIAQQDSHRRLMAAAKDIHDGVGDMRRAAVAAHANYSAAVQANVDMWQG
ncbi:WXG100 family type VII secretion target [Nocardia brasiliensis]|uniref:ESAT-6-like protein n=1 Tax=Nocardia brasiliensis (strain ATCC 700358 / HUJEG-1) TaxID=1133849 RepID=K0EL86_NOCB7|nr:WXG100 family type VII secretion target [Nocardia brasiliensis]AFT98221.1 hypothetical protein O3I_001295 [Nocardia brasiliensis ATCC 700358]OCF90884.1 hypothetical protein AW168_08590 [Nocardia brasiliensis]